MISHSIGRKIRSFTDRALNRVLPDYVGDEYFCPVCRTGVAYFSPLPNYFLKELDRNQHVYSIFQSETLNLEQYNCPRCGSSDRDRLYALFVAKELEQEKSYKLLDFAPGPALSSFLKGFGNIEYRSADLLMEGVDDVVDITDMHVYADDTFDVIICSHVLEHVPDDLRAMSELRRVLAPGGWAIVMVPINLGLENIHEDPSITDEGLRWKYFGQDDHVRMYSKSGFVSRLEQVGFTVEQYGIEYFGAETFSSNGIHARSVLYIVHK